MERGRPSLFVFRQDALETGAPQHLKQASALRAGLVEEDNLHTRGR